MPTVKYLKGAALSVLLAMSMPHVLAAEKKGGGKKAPKTIAELTKDRTPFEGYFDLYQDPKTGSTMILVEQDQLDKPFLYFAVTANGVLDAGTFKGSFREQRVLEFKKYFDRIEVVSMTPRYLLDESSAIKRSEGTNISPAILATLKIEAEDKENGRYLLKADPLFLSESLHKVSPTARPRRPGQPPSPPRFKVGGLSKQKTKYAELRNYEKNTDVVVDYVFDNRAPSVRGSRSVSDPRSVTVSLQHSFIELPENDYQPRRDDARVGFFTTEFDDLSSNSFAPFKDVINRWHLVKKDPSAELSEPVEPITWWIENTTPMEWRDVIKEAGESWNIAFEKAGFKNAMVVKVQPDNADWDAGDITKNVLRWTASPRPPFGGYGPSIKNPLTGQIIGADIMLEYSFFRNRGFFASLFGGPSAFGEEAADPFAELAEHGLICSAGHQLHDSMMSGLAMAGDLHRDVTIDHELVEQAMRYLILHEIGHTLGLNHNMKATQLFNAVDVHNKAMTQGVIAGSVMDYPSVNVAPPGVEQGDYYVSKPGPYDLWAIEYGYSPAAADASQEEARLTTILSRSTEPELAFGNDADDMRRPGFAIDPRVMIGDMSSDAVNYARGRFELINDTFKTLKDKNVTEGDSYQQLLTAANYLMGEWRTQAGVVSRYVGGVYVDRAFAGQPGETQPLTPVPLATQKAAMNTLRDHLFSPEVLREAQPVFAYLLPQRRGFSHAGRNEDPKLHQIVLRAQTNTLNHLLHPNVLMRISDTALYGNQYDLNTYMNDLTAAVFDADLTTDVNTYRQVLQMEYVTRLMAASGLKGKTRYDYVTRSIASQQLRDIVSSLRFNKGRGATRAHRNYLVTMIDKAFANS